MDLGIRWALDADERARFDQPAVSTATFRAGLERLALGVVLGDEDVVVAGAVPYDGGDRALVGRFIDAVETLHSAVERLSAVHRVTDLQGVLDETIASLFAPKDPWQAHQVRSLVAKVVEAAREEMRHCLEFDYVIMNQDFARAVDDLSVIVRAARLAAPRQQVRHAALIADLLKI